MNPPARRSTGALPRVAGGVAILAVVVGISWWLLAGRAGDRGPDGLVFPSGSGSLPTPGGSGPASATPPRIWLVVLENRSYAQVIGSNQAPSLTALANRYGLATDYHAVARPSQPNYLALVSGSTQGVADNTSHDISAPSLFEQLDDAGRSWRVYAENVPEGCFSGASANGGADGPGTYARKHEPAISFTAISGNPSRCARITNLAAFNPDAADAPDFSLIVPNLCHDMHDCSTREGDRWLGSFASRLLASNAFRNGGILLVTFDESDGDDAGQHVALVVARGGMAQGTRFRERATHYSLLRSIQDAYGLPCLATSCDARAIPGLLANP
jgi:hypothetical protein